jgi:hypothetical protein
MTTFVRESRDICRIRRKWGTVRPTLETCRSEHTNAMNDLTDDERMSRGLLAMLLLAQSSVVASTCT